MSVCRIACSRRKAAQRRRLGPKASVVKPGKGKAVK